MPGLKASINSLKTKLCSKAYNFFHISPCKTRFDPNFRPQLNIKQQEKLVGMFNDYLETERKKYHSLFLTNYRENGRKRISFSLAFEIVNYLLNSKEL